MNESLCKVSIVVRWAGTKLHSRTEVIRTGLAEGAVSATDTRFNGHPVT